MLGIDWNEAQGNLGGGGNALHPNLGGVIPEYMFYL